MKLTRTDRRLLAELQRDATRKQLLGVGPRRLARRAQRAADRGEASAPGTGELP